MKAMARLLVGVAALLAASATPLVAQVVQCPPDTALLLPNNPAYPDALDLQHRLQQNGFTVDCIFPTKLSSIFMVEKDGMLQSTVEGEACFSTNYGGLDVVFVPRPQTFSGFDIAEQRKGRGYAYRFTGTPHSASEGKFNFGTATRQYFLKHDNYLIIVGDAKLLTRLQESLSQPTEP